MADLLENIKNAGVVGAGGAGFPTHVKVNCKAEVVIANGAECEPLLNVDQCAMRDHAGEIVSGMETVMQITGAARGLPPAAQSRLQRFSAEKNLSED